MFKSRNISLAASQLHGLSGTGALHLAVRQCRLVSHGEAMVEAVNVPTFMHQDNVQDQPVAHEEV